MIPVLPHDQHACTRLDERFGLFLDDVLKTEIMDLIHRARLKGNRSNAAVLLEKQIAPTPRERWLVSVRGAAMQVIVPVPVLVTILPADARRFPR